MNKPIKFADIFSTPDMPPEPFMAPLDGCPKCVTRNHPPLYSFPVGQGSVGCYVCYMCGHSWWTGWGAA